MDYRDWGYDTRGPRDRRASDDARPSERGSTGEVERFRARRAGAHRADGDVEAEPPRIGYATLSEFRSAYRGRRRQEDTSPTTDRPYGRRSARERWEERADESRDLRPEVSTAEWTREAYTGEWNRSDYVDKPQYTDRSDFTGQWSTGETSTEQWTAPASWDEGTGRRSRSESRRARRGYDSGGTGWGDTTRADRSDTGRRSYDPPPSSSIPASAMPSSSMPSSSIPSSSMPASGLPRRYEDFRDRYDDSEPDQYARPSWAVARDRSSTGRRRRSWQDQIEPRWDTDEAETDIEPPWEGGDGGRDKFETRWTAGELDDETSVRLARDDPRWVGIPSSAPRSPAVAYPDDLRGRVPAPRSAPPLDRGFASRQRAVAPAYSRRASVVEVDDDDDLLDEAPRGTTAGAILATLAWYAVPLVIFVVYTFTVGSADRAQAFNSLVGATGRFGAALALSVVVAVFVRWLTATWRSVSVGLAAAVVGGGLSTVVLSVISGQPLG